MGEKGKRNRNIKGKKNDNNIAIQWVELVLVRIASVSGFQDESW